MKAIEILKQQFITCQWANGQFCSINAPLQQPANPPSCIAAIYAKNKAGIEKRCSLQIKNTNSATIPTPIVPNVWLLTLAPTVVLTGIICPDEAPRFIKTQTPIYILCLPAACSTTSQHFHLPPCYESHQLTINISLNTTNLNMMNSSSPDFRIWQHLKDHWDRTKLHHLVNIPSLPTDQLYKHMINSNGPIIPFHFNQWVNRWYSITLDTIFSYWNLCNSYMITDTPRIRDILLWLFLVKTCQISILTCAMIRFFTTYYCGWWCRGSTHLQMWHVTGWTAYKKTSW